MTFKSFDMKKVIRTIVMMGFIQFAFAGLVHAQLTSLPDAGNKRRKGAYDR